MSVLASVLIGLAAGALPSSVIAGLFAFRVNRATATKLETDAEKNRTDTQLIARNTAVAEAEKALAWSEKRFGMLETDYGTCMERVVEQGQSLWALIDAIEAIMSRVQSTDGEDVTVSLTGEDMSAVRSAIREARQHLK